MAKKQQNNKIGESFEQQLPDEFVPDFIWDNIANSLENSSTPIESTEKVKTSFEEGFDNEALPVFLWEGIETSLDQTSVLDPSLDSNNKIKTSFETGHQDLVPEDLWKM